MASEYFNIIASQLGMSVWLLIMILVWSLTWKLLALWKSARKGALVWFIVLALFNTVGVLEILYIFVFSKLRMNHKPVTKTKKKTRKKKSVKKRKKR